MTGTKTALVTGASSGIGAKLAAEFAADGYDVVVTARRKQRLEALAGDLESSYGIDTTVVTADLAEENAPRHLYEELRDREIRVDALVNNAGFMTFGDFHETDVDRERDMIQVNQVALTRLAKLFGRDMVERGHGEILNTASMAGMVPTPGTAVYSATKAYVLSFSEAVAHEFEPHGVTVTALCPGPVDTEIFESGGFEDSGADPDERADPAQVAAAGYRGLKEGKRVVVPSRKMKVLSQAKRVLPRRKAVSIAAGTYEQES